jgi:hypothetical protein
MFFKRAKQDKKKTSETPAEPAPAATDEQKAPEPPKKDTKEPKSAASAPPVDPETLGFKTTADVVPEKGPLGQSKALEAIAFGAGIKGPGYNILVAGGPGSGSGAATRAKIKEVAAAKKPPSDWVYLSYFDADGGFRAMELQPGNAKAFAEAMASAIDRLADALPVAFAADDYDLKRRAIEEEFRFSREDALEALRREAEAQNIALLRTPTGIAVAPILEGKVVKSDVFNSVPESLRREVEAKISALESEIEKILAGRPAAEKSRREGLLAINEQVAGRQVRSVLDDIKEKFGDVAGMERFLNAAGRDLVRNAGLFLGLPLNEAMTVPVATMGDARFARYRVHVMATAVGEQKGAPVIEEPNPTYANLFGRVELAPAGDGRAAAITRIRPGALHRANGGFLITDARGLLSAPGVVDALSRAFETQEIRFDPPAEPVGVATGEIPELEPIPLNLKVVVLADAEAHRELAKDHPQLMRHFKVEAVFDDAIDRSPDTIAALARRIAGIVAENELKPVEAKGVALLIDEAARKAGGNGKISTEIGHIADLCREADHWAKSDGRETTSVADVERAIVRQKERNGAQGAAP